MLIRAVEDMFASPTFLAAQVQSSALQANDRQSSAAPAMNLQGIDDLYTALLKVTPKDS